MTYALDTNIVSDLLKGHERISARYAEAVGRNDAVAVPALVRIELLLGRFASVKKAGDGATARAMYELLVRTETALAPLPLLPINAEVAERFDRLRVVKKLSKLAVADLIIAAIALAHDATLVTRNTKDFANVPNLKIDNRAD